MIKNLKKEITINIIVSLIFITFINPISIYMWEVLKNVYSRYIDRIYEKASYGLDNRLDFIIFVMIISTICMMVSLLNINTYLRYKKREDKEYEESLKSPNRLEVITITSKSIIDKTTKFSAYFMVPLMNILILGIVFNEYVIHQLNRSFNKRMLVVAPYIEEHIEESLKAKWALMDDRDDFVAIDRELEGIAQEYHVKLPENLLK